MSAKVKPITLMFVMFLITHVTVLTIVQYSLLIVPYSLLL